jgi:hypothetical protein
MLAEICDALDDARCLAFRVDGFGQLPWPVDVRTDLLTVLEQLPDILKSIRNPGVDEFLLDFYEQGIERQVTFRKRGIWVDLRCESRLDWVPQNDTETIRSAALEVMMRGVARVFIDCVRRLLPSVDANPNFQAWCDSLVLG